MQGAESGCGILLGNPDGKKSWEDLDVDGTII